MRWILIWWVVHPMHMQVAHLERGFPSEEACAARGSQLQAPAGKVIHWHCSLE